MILLSNLLDLALFPVMTDWVQPFERALRNRNFRSILRQNLVSLKIEILISLFFLKKNLLCSFAREKYMNYPYFKATINSLI